VQGQCVRRAAPSLPLAQLLHEDEIAQSKRIFLNSLKRIVLEFKIVTIETAHTKKLYSNHCFDTKEIGQTSNNEDLN
jgi:hypothetical protein